MTISSAALAALLLGAAYLAPLAWLHYHAWRYRENGNTQSLSIVARRIADGHAERAVIKKLLGPPRSETAAAMIYAGRWPVRADPTVICIWMNDDRATGLAESGGP
jgi:hypothetical protein